MLFESELPEDISAVITKWRNYTAATGLARP
jgi:hypothetical protein